MPLPLPTLDRLTFEELVSEARSSLPALAPGWTDYNAHDPGITLIELLAWLAESASYRLDNIPEASYRAFLRLAGVERRAAQVAKTMLVFKPTGAALNLQSGIAVLSKNGDVAFQTTAELLVSSAKLRVLLSSAGGVYEDITARNNTTTSTFLPLGIKPQPGDALYFGFDLALAPADSILRLGVWTSNECADLETRTQLVAEQNKTEGDVACVCPVNFPTQQWDWLRHYGAHMVWEYYANSGQWQALQEVEDDTRALTLSGTVRFKAPADQKSGGVTADYESKYIIRCRLAHGTYDCPPRIAYVALNVVVARHAVDAPTQTFRSNGRAAQRFEFDRKPAVADSAKLTVTLNGVADNTWHAATNWDGVGAHQRSYVMNNEVATILFGDGRSGRVPPAGAEIKVNYQAGGGTSGNVPAKTLVKLASTITTVEVEQPFAACGGKAAETLNEAKARAVRELARPTRVVTLEDFEEIALATPGVQVARVHAIPDYHPAMPCIPVTGSTSVVVLPPCPAQRPVPTSALLATVQRYLERRRVLTSEIHVIAPHYTIIAVNALLQAQPEADRNALKRLARSTLEQFFNPLQGGPDGKGWPIGRDVYRAELLALLNDLEGVLYVEEMSWHVDGKDATRCGNISICRHGLVASGIHEITINEGSSGHE